MVFQKFGLLPHRNVLQNTVYGLEIQGVPKGEREERANIWIKRVGLDGFAGHYPNQLSGGMQQRVGLARALTNDAEILLMDEAYSALDPLIRVDMQSVLLDLQKELKKTIVFITHDLNEAMRLGDRIAMMRDGRIVQIGTAEDILIRPANDYVASFTKDVDRSRVLTADAVMDTDLRGDEADCGCETARPDSSFVDLCAISARVPHSVAVVDKAQKLVGVVPRQRLIGFLGDEQGEPRPCDAPRDKVVKAVKADA